MAVVRIEEMIYSVTDVEASAAFFTDAGLEPLASSDANRSFRTPANQYLRLHLAPSSGEAPGVEEIIWGVDDDAGLQVVHTELARDRTVERDAAGTLHTHDDGGYRIAFKVAAPTPVTAAQPQTNLLNDVRRRNRGVEPHGRPRPLRVIHVALDILKETRERANAFYTDRLHFRAIDRVAPMGTFMQCEGDIEHHNLLLCHRPDQRTINHVALEVSDIDEVIEGGNYMTERGWKESRRLGRHNLGSNVFRMFHAPCGGRIEFAFDMDRMDKTFVPRRWEKTPQHHLWMLKFPGDTDR